MDRFILTDLNKAEKLLKGYTRESANEAVVYGLKARYWIDLASRFDYQASELQAMPARTIGPRSTSGWRNDRLRFSMLKRDL